MIVWSSSTSIFSLLFPRLCNLFSLFPPKSSTSQGNKCTFRSRRSSLAGCKPSNLEQGRPGKCLSRRIHLCTPQASYFIARSLKACLMCCSKWEIALIDHPNTILCRPQANSGLSVLVKLVFVYVASFGV